MNLINGGVVTDVEWDGGVGFATIELNGRKLFVEFPIKYVEGETTISNAWVQDPQDSIEWDVYVAVPKIAGDLTLYTWQGSADDFTEGKILFDIVVLDEIERLLEVKAAEMTLEGECDEW